MNEWRSEAIEQCMNPKKPKIDYDPMIVEEVYQNSSHQREV